MTYFFIVDFFKLNIYLLIHLVCMNIVKEYISPENNNPANRLARGGRKVKVY